MEMSKKGQTIFELVAALTGNRSFDRDTDFYRVGVSSIGKAIRLAKELSEVFDVPVTLRDLQKNHTIAAMEKWLSEDHAVPVYELQDDYPLTAAQEGVLADCLSDPDSVSYNIPILYDLSDTLDLDRLKNAVITAFRAHPYLCAALCVDKEGNHRIKRSAATEPVVDVITAASLPGKLVKPFDLSGERLYRANIYKTDSGNHLFIDIHHLLTDLNGLGIFVEDINSAYLGEPLKEELYSGYEIALDEKMLRNSGLYDEDKAYYEELLKDADKGQQLPFDVNRKEGKTGNIRYNMSVDPGKLREFCKGNGVTETSFFNGLLAFVLSKYNYSDEAVFTTISNGRNSSRMNRSTSMMIETIPVFCRMDKDGSVIDLLAAVSKQILDSVPHDLYSFAEISKQYDITDDIMLAYQGDISIKQGIGGEPAKVHYLAEGSQRPLSIEVFNDGEKIDLVCDYECDHFSEAYIGNFLSCMEVAAEGFLSKELLRDVSILSPEAAKIIDRLNDTDHPVMMKNIHRLFEEQVRLHPDRTAVIFGDERVTYKRLNEMANMIADSLISRGLKPGEFVGMLLPRGIDVAACEYGILKAGGAFLPMLTEYPDDRVDYCMRDSGSRFLITSQLMTDERGELFKDAPYSVLNVADLYQGNSEDHDIEVPSDSPAYCIYTSGSTGKPKGVVIEHGNLCNFVNANEKNEESRCYVSGGSVALGFASLSFDVSVMEIHLSLTNGITLAMASEEERETPLLLAEMLEKNKVDIVCVTPSFLDNMLEVPEMVRAFGNIKMYDLGAEAFPPSLYARIRQASPGAVIVNGYGPTEATISCISKVIEDDRNITIGRPAANVKAWIVDKYCNILPPGARGELLIGGMGVGRGYVNLPDKTKEVFIEFEGQRAYRSGDLARINMEGEIEFFGRLDNQVKLNGLRIELDEIENVINTYPGIERSVVLVYTPETGDPFLCAWFTSTDQVDTDKLKAHVAKSLARYMIPRAFVRISSIPLTSNAKVDRKALPKPQMVSEEIILPQNDIQRRIFDCVAGVLGNESFGIKTDLYDAGLTSLGAIRLNVLLSKEFNIPFTIRDVQKNPTILLLEEFLSHHGETEVYELLKDYPLSQCQKGVLVECMAHPDTVIYNVPLLLKLPQDIDTHRLKEAAEKVIAAHPYMNATIFTDDEGDFRVKREDDTAPVVDEICVSSLPEKMISPFELMGGKLYRACIYKTDAGDYFFLDCHHIIYDGGSEEVFMRDLSAAYEGKEVEREGYTGFEYALDEEKQRLGAEYKAAEDYYTELLSEADHDMLPEADEEGDTESSDAFTYDTSLDMGRIRDFCRENNVTENAFMSSVFAFVLSRFTGKDEALYTTVYNGRNDSRLADAVAMLVKTFPVYINTADDRNVKEYISSMGRQLMDSMSHDLYSYSEIARRFDLGTDVLFVYQGEDEEYLIDGKAVEVCPLALDVTKAPIHMDACVRKSCLSFDMEYRSDLYSEDFLKSFVQCLEQVAWEFLRAERLGDVDLLSPKALEKLDSFNDTEVPYDKSENIVSLFRKTASGYAGNTAVICRDRKLTYSELDDLSERIAAYVRSKGLGRGDVVSVLIPRSEYMPVASLGVLKAGCAYQPLDTTYPSQRLNFMIGDSGAGLLITTGELRPILNEYEGPVLYIDDIPSLPAPSSPVDVMLSPDDTFILLYTSGSTGVPKGVQLTHGNIVCFSMWAKRYYGLTSEAVVGAYASYGFDVHMMDTYPTLLAGAAEVIVPEDIRLDLIAMNEYMEENRVSHMFMTTQVGRQFATSVDNKTLKSLSVAGEKLVTLDPPSYQFHNGYGPTETTVFITCYQVREKKNNIPIGKPLDNVKIYIVGANKKRVPIGAHGELWAAGPQVAKGYLNRPEKTAEVFITNPFVSENDEYSHAYRTGDIVRYLPDGNIQFLGRRDGQVKIRGFRIEMSEVEAVLREYPGISDATVAAFDHPSGGKFLAAYIVSDSEPDPEAIGDFIRQRKPPYMVPEVIMQLDKIPLNQNGKVNKRALPKPEKRAVKTEASKAPAAPLNLLEKELKDMIAGLIGSMEFGITDSLKDLGLSSISGIRLAMQLYKKYNVQMNARDLAAFGTIQSIENAILETLLDQGSGKGEEKGNDGDKDFGEKKSCRLSFAQQGVYMEYQANPGTVQYNIPFALRFPPGISEQDLAEAVRKVVNAHPYILCRFVPDADNEIIQEPIPDFTLEIPVREMPEAEYEKYRKAFVRPFEPDKGPCVRFEIIKTDSLILLADMHHLVSDGVSMDIFFDQLCRALDGEEPETEKYTYYDYAGEEKITPEVEDFFKKQMEGVEEATGLIPDVFETGLPHSVGEISIKTDFSKVKDYAIKNGVTPAGVYLAATLIACGRYTCEDMVSIATIANGRTNLKLANTIGMFVNTLPLVCTIDNKEKTVDFVRRVAGNFRDTIDHENYPFARIAGSYDFHPQISYTYQIGVMSRYKTKLGEVKAEGLELDIAKLPASVYIDGNEEAAVIQVAYDSSMYSKEMMEGFAGSIENAVKGLIEKDSLDEISLTDEASWKLLDSFNKEWDLDYDKDDTAITVFKRNVKAQPDKTAAVYMDRSYTYRELDELTDRLAAKIYKEVCNITGKTSLKEEVAALLLHRNENVFLLPLAVLKAGLAYEPLDPGYPGDRLNFMVRDADACLLITDDDLRDVIDEYEGRVITVSELGAMADEDVMPDGPAPEDLFTLLYTSGSTGLPKGCQLEHRNLVAYAHGVRNDFYTRDDKIAAYASFGFDVNMSDIFCTLMNGGTVYLISEDIRMNLDSLAAYFDEVGITALLLTTQVGVQFLQNYPDLKSLRMLVMGGEKLPAVDPSKIGYTIVNGYGPTENCCGVSLFPIHSWEPNIPIGKPMSTIHGYVLDKTGHRLMPGAAGEYCLSGPQVSRGYLNRPDKTAEAYQDSPFDEFRMYHTGDIVRYRANGDVEFVGRKDGQVKIRGFRIETKEVEAVIRGYEGIRDVTVQAYDYENGGKYLAAFVVSDSGIDTADLTEYIKGQKPAYMVPAVIMQIDAVPLTVNQKVDKKALPRPQLQRAEYVAPVGKTEEDFCAVFAEVLGIDKVSALDDFFEIGGSSILAMKVVIAAGKAGYGIVYNDVFNNTTPRAMAEYLNRGSEVQSGTGAAGEIPEVGSDGYDYTRIHELLSRNTPEAFKNGERQEISDVLLFGATGYLGSHVLYELITGYEGRIICFVRPGKDETGQDRLRSILAYYFDDDHAGLFGSRITVIEGDATDPASLEAFKAVSGNMTVINCAASVKHFARNNEINRVNVESVRNICSWCEKNGARLVHISTGSVFGSRRDNIPPAGYKFDERRLYSGQVIDNNQYIHSKFMAERHIYEEMLDHGLRAKVMRVGNLSPRYEDGRFQINYKTNNFMNSVRALKALGMISMSLMDVQVEFSPIDQVAKAVLTLAQTPEECICFLPLNPHRAIFDDIIRVLGEEGYGIDSVMDEEFGEALAAALTDDEKREAVSSLVAYQSNDDTTEIGLDDATISYTVYVLKKLGFSWPETGADYIRRFVRKLSEKSFF